MKLFYNPTLYKGNAGDFTANKDVVYPPNTILQNTFSGLVYFADGVKKLSELDPINAPAQ